MFVSDCLGINELDHLTIGGVDTLELAQKYGTPLYVMDEEQIRAGCRSFKDGIARHYGGNGAVAYASKAFCCKEMCRIAKDENLWLDVVSGSELYTAMAAGFPAGRLLLHGNNKTPQELGDALRGGVGRIVVDNVFELQLIDQMAGAAGVTAGIQLRVKPGVEAHTHDFIQTGQIDSKFGFALETGEAFAAVKQALRLPNLSLKGLHCHIGSQIFDIASFELTAKVMLGLFQQVKQALGYQIPELNLGGGYGIKYLPEDAPSAPGDFLAAIAASVRATCAEQNLPEPFLFIEPGRSIVGPAGITLYTVGAIKEIPGIRTYVTVDGGMADNPRYALYGAKYHMLLAAGASRPKTGPYTVAGRCCESGDLLGEDVPLPQPQVGEVLAVLATGAYNYSMASHYNRLPNPAVVMVRGGASRVRRQARELRGRRPQRPLRQKTRQQRPIYPFLSWFKTLHCDHSMLTGYNI